ncbi:uncharacterized protein LOC119080315 [Bradysia coprophila]|uniref:uncharacterized protein LOC119080315 n=1 Tax=Bradysia coprophila TaxID=38358 RepID=UPI00187D6FE7|nr:uncharacterized protein LOC119080315 [Bradysia coprophila]
MAYSEEESVMDRVLFIIKDDLPKNVLGKIWQPLSKIKNVRHIQDMTAFFLIEFITKVDCDAARAKGFEYVDNNQTIAGEFVNQGVIAAYMKGICKDGIGVGR